MGYKEPTSGWHQDKSLRAGFLASARQFPERPALQLKKQVFTYDEVADLGLRWASSLIDVVEGANGRKPCRVGVFGYRSVTSYVGVLTSLFAGAAFVPLSPRFPLERTRSMIELADLDAVIVDEESQSQWTEIMAVLSRKIPGLLTASNTSLETALPLANLPPIDPEDVAYLLFTSGSTGKPKGVPITHGNVRAFLDYNRTRYDLRTTDRLTQTFDQTFDLSIFDLFMAWEAGACVCVMQPIELLAPARFLRENDVTVWFSVPSVAARLLSRGALIPNSMPSLRWSLFCGEGLPVSTAQAWQAAAPNSVVENLYGPTELTIACSVYRWDSQTSPAEAARGLVPIGKIYPTMTHIVVDDDLCEVELGEIGELCVAGPQTSPGYWREITESRFIERLDSDGKRVRFYRTGDVVRLIGNNYAYLGRTDDQIKVGGYRIELGEIEAVLHQGGCTEAVALAWPDNLNAQYILAVVSGCYEEADLRAAAVQCLPNYMIPKFIIDCVEMPLNSNGKVDRPSLRRWLADHETILGAEA